MYSSRRTNTVSSVRSGPVVPSPTNCVHSACASSCGNRNIGSTKRIALPCTRCLSHLLANRRRATSVLSEPVSYSITTRLSSDGTFRRAGHCMRLWSRDLAQESLRNPDHAHASPHADSRCPAIPSMLLALGSARNGNLTLYTCRHRCRSAWQPGHRAVHNESTCPA